MNVNELVRLALEVSEYPEFDSENMKNKLLRDVIKSKKFLHNICNPSY